MPDRNRTDARQDASSGMQSRDQQSRDQQSQQPQSQQQQAQSQQSRDQQGIGQQSQPQQPQQQQQQQQQQGRDSERAISVSREGPGSAATQRGNRSMASQRGTRSHGETTLLPTLMSNPGLMASAFLSNPYGFARAMNQEFDRMFGMDSDAVSPFDQSRLSNRSDRSFGTQQGLSRGSAFMPAVEVKQVEDEMIVCADLPGVNADDVHVELDEGMLTISGERRTNREENEEGFYRTERSYGSFTRSIAVPDGIDEDKVKASFDNGVLEVTIPIPETQRQRRRRIDVNSGASRRQSEPEQSIGRGENR